LIVLIIVISANCIVGYEFNGKKTITYDIHMKVNSEVEHYVEDQLAPAIAKLLPHNDLNFTQTIPHITLYMTSFMRSFQNNIAVTFKETAAKILHQYPQCNVTMRAAYATGYFYLWHTSIPPCLQAMSDAFVTNLAQFRDVNQSIPKWLLNITEPQRTEMIKLFKMYGSPSVMSYFDPHVTVAWDDREPMDPLEKLEFPPFNITVSQLAVGVTTAHGAVLRGHDLIAYPSPEYP